MTRLKQAAVIALGLVVGAIMLGLGIWQLNVYGAQGTQVAQNRAAEPAVPLEQVARPGQPVDDGYGRTVQVTGRYDPKLQILIPLPDQPGYARVLTALRLAGGGAVPVVRGVVPAGSAAPTPPSGEISQRGILLASEAAPDVRPGSAAPTDPNQLSSVQLPVLVQDWSEELVNGFITLDAPDARGQSLAPATAVLPQGEGRSRNAAYALQWWVFAAFAIGMAAKMARDIGRRDDFEELLADSETEPGRPADSQPSADRAT